MPHTNVKGHLLPLNPPSVCEAPKSVCKRSIREIEKRRVSFAARNVRTDVEVESDLGIITDWEMLVCFCKSKFQPVIEDCDKVTVKDVSGNPPTVTYSVSIDIDFSVVCYKNSMYVPVRNLVGGFSAKLERLSELKKLKILNWALRRKFYLFNKRFYPLFAMGNFMNVRRFKLDFYANN